MNKIIRVFTLLIFTVIVIQSCQEAPKEVVSTEQKVVEKPLNPNGDSELALLMREMFTDVERIKAQVQNGEKVTVQVDHEKILSAHATEPAKAASAEFKTWGTAYLEGIETLKNASPENAEAVYTSLISSCMSCHQSFCPGPIVRIKKLKLSE
jgi:cytochrome c556